MAEDKHKNLAQVQSEAEKDYEAMEGNRKGFLGRFNARFNDALQQGRSAERHGADGMPTPLPPAPTGANPNPQQHHEPTGDDLALRNAKSVGAARMVVPEGVVIEGSLMGGTDTEIHGRITGDISIDGRLYLGQKAVVSGNVKATACHIDGNVEGKVECSDEVQLGSTGRVHADLLAGKRIILAGQVYGNVATPGALRLAATCRVDGDVRARNLSMEEGAALNGKCIMRAPTQGSSQSSPQQPAQQQPAQQAQAGQKK